MVVEALTQKGTDLLFHALADATRRDIVARVIFEEQSVSALAGRYAMSFAATQKHVAVLERAALVSKHRRGREQIVHVDLTAIHKAGRLLQEFEDLWRQRADRIESILAEDDGRASEIEEGTAS